MSKCNKCGETYRDGTPHQCKGRDRSDSGYQPDNWPANVASSGNNDSDCGGSNDSSGGSDGGGCGGGDWSYYNQNQYSRAGFSIVQEFLSREKLLFEEFFIIQICVELLMETHR